MHTHTHTQLYVHSLLTYARSAHSIPLCMPQSNAAASKKSLRQTKCKDQARPQHNFSTASHLVDARNRGAKSSGHVTTVPGDDGLPRRGAGQTRARTRQAGSLALLLHEVGHLRLGGLRQLRKARAHPLRVPQELFAALLHTLRGGMGVGRVGRRMAWNTAQMPCHLRGPWWHRSVHEPRHDSSLALQHISQRRQPRTFSSPESRSLRRKESTQSRKHRSTRLLYIFRLSR